MGASPATFVLVGFMAAGKTRIGRLLAHELQIPFVDTDEEIEKSTHSTIADLFRTLGEREFRRIERETIARLVAAKPQVMSIGGGAFLHEQTREMLNRDAVTIWLDPPFELIVERLSRSNDRPLAAGKSVAEIGELWCQRRPLYQLARIRIATTDGDPTLAVSEILGAIK